MSNFTTQKKWFDGAIRGLLLNPVNIALALLLVVLAYLVLWPFFQLVFCVLPYSPFLLCSTFSSISLFPSFF